MVASAPTASEPKPAPTIEIGNENGPSIMSSSVHYQNYFYVFRDIIRSMHSSQNLQEVLDVVVLKSTAVLQAKGALLRIFNPASRQFDVRAACGMGSNYLSKGPVSTERILSDPSELHKVKVIRDLWQAPRVEYPQQAWNEGVRMIVDVPLAIHDQMIGLIRIYLGIQRDFTDHELDFMLTLGEQCACIIERAQLMENQKEHFDLLAAQMDKMSALGRMAAGIAHEINNPLTGILLYSTHMRKKVAPGAGLDEGLDIIIKETQRCKTIIQGLLDFARNNAPQRVTANINRIAESALGILENEFHLRHVDILLNTDKNMVDILVDENQMEQVMINLLLNALMASEENGRVVVKTRADIEAGSVWIEVIDDGCGIAQQNLKKIFDPFFSTKSSGVGLGLAISYGIIQNHGGEIEVFSTPGKGARFAIRLPIHKEKTES